MLWSRRWHVNTCYVSCLWHVSMCWYGKRMQGQTQTLVHVSLSCRALTHSLHRLPYQRSAVHSLILPPTLSKARSSLERREKSPTRSQGWGVWAGWMEALWGRGFKGLWASWAQWGLTASDTDHSRFRRKRNLFPPGCKRHSMTFLNNSCSNSNKRKEMHTFNMFSSTLGSQTSDHNTVTLQLLPSRSAPLNSLLVEVAKGHHCHMSSLLK